jgi:5-methylcytosine-specific restriction endonuclease McrA
MSCLPKTRPIRMDRTQYPELQRAILLRDGWRCQVCGTRSHLEVHHQQFRSRSGDDTEENLITLCHDCHSGEHRR